MNKDVSPTIKQTKQRSAFNIRSTSLSEQNDVSGNFLIQNSKEKGTILHSTHAISQAKFNSGFGGITKSRVLLVIHTQIIY